MLSYLCRSNWFRRWFGDFEPAELKKFLYLGVIFAFVIGVYWTLRPLKDALFLSMVPKQHLALAKIVSLFVLFPVVMLYSKAVEKFHKHNLFYALGLIYFVLTMGFGLFFMYSPYGLADTTINTWRLSAWAWYVFVESYGSLMVALFWAFATDITTADSAKRGFGLTVMIGQLGSIFGPYFLTPLGKTYFGSVAPVLMICAGLILVIICGIYFFMATTPKDQLEGFHGKNEKAVESHQEPGFLEGLKLMLSQKYLLGIFGIIAIYEILSTIIDFNFKQLVAVEYPLAIDSAKYLGDYAVWVNLISFLCLFFGINNIQRYFGVKTSLALMPFIIVGFIMLFLMYGQVEVLFWLMVLAKAINYALNGPTMKQLYVPTTSDVKYKSQAWIETFGSRGAKATSSVFNFMSESLGSYFLITTALLSCGLGAGWFLIAVYLGNTFQKAVDEKKVVC